jgi:serine protease inhibitor
MVGTRNLFIDDVIHQAFVDVNEERTLGSGCNSGGHATDCNAGREPVPVFEADHLFIFGYRTTGQEGHRRLNR